MDNVQVHPEFDGLREFFSGRLSGEQAHRLEAHLLECESCLHVFKEMEASDPFMASIRGRAGDDAFALPENVDMSALIQKLQSAIEQEHNAESPSDFGSGAYLRDTEQTKPLPSILGFNIIGEIGRGGMGIVYRARDVALDREVALKFLHDQYAADSPAARRFLEEARITGQLQHPGIPAIYQIGMLSGGRPYLAMKLIKGQTLEELLKDRAVGPPNWVAVFEAICQAVGYAHAHHVIHRDLKPSNIMVGNFGEVQVMDWGVAKVLLAASDHQRGDESSQAETLGTEIRTLRDSDFTQNGSVMGTPAFMSPEQAAGEVDLINQRSDVFSLGAILCVILTGQSPYTGKNAEAVRLAAMRGKLDDAFARLDASGAEPALIALAKSCMSFEPADRFSDARVVAVEVAKLRADAEQRARDAELQRAKAEVQAAEQRKRRKVQLALGLLLAVAAVMGIAIRERGIEQRKATQAIGLVQTILNADTAQVPTILGQLIEYRKWADPLLREENEKAAATSRQKLHASLALLPVDSRQVEYLSGRLFEAEPRELPVIRDALAPHKDKLLEKLWAAVETPDKGKERQRLRAAAALAMYDPQSDRWGKAGAPVVNDLVHENPIFLGQWSEAFRLVKYRLVPRLSEIFRDHQPERSAECNLATSILSDYAADQPQMLADLLMDADDKQFTQFTVIYLKFKEHGERGSPWLSAEIDRKLPPDAADDAKEKLAKRQACAAVVLLKMNQAAKVWPLLKHSPDPSGRSYLIHRLGPLGADAKAIVMRLDEEPDLTIRRALLLSLGEFGDKEFPVDDRKALLPKLREMY
jgi:serine/threonine protein kinase